MASHLTHGQLIIQDENFDIHSKNLVAGGRSKPPTKKGGTELGCLKALKDLTIKSALHHEASSRKMNLSEEEFNIEGDMILHDHEKCIEALMVGEFNIEDNMILDDHEKCIQQPLMGTGFWDVVLSGQDSVSHFEDPVSEQTESGLDGPCCCPERFKLSMSEFSDSLAVSTQSVSPPYSPLRWDSPPSPPFAWKPVNIVVKEDSVSF